MSRPGGISAEPQVCVLDNLKEGVIKPDLYEPELNSVYAAVLAHYGVVADPARVRDPNRKGTVENAIGHTQSTALKGRRFESHRGAERTSWNTGKPTGRRNASTAAPGVRSRPCSRRNARHSSHCHCRAFSISPSANAPLTTTPAYASTTAATRHARRASAARVLVRLFEHHLEIRDRQTHALLRTHPRAEQPRQLAPARC